MSAIDNRPPRPWRDRRRISMLHFASRIALMVFERRTRRAVKANRKALRDVLKRNSKTVFGADHDLQSIRQGGDLIAQFKSRVPLASYADHEPYIDRIAAGEQSVLSSDPTNMLAGTSGTTDRPKRIPRTLRAQRRHMMLVVLAEQAVIDRGIEGATAPDRGVNLMSLYAPSLESESKVPIMSGPNAGMSRIRKQIPLLWSSPEAVFGIAHQPTALYLHGLFALLNRRTLYIQTPFAPQVVGWFTLMEKYQQHIVTDIRTGKLSGHLELTTAKKQDIERDLRPDPDRANEVAAEFEKGFEAIAPRLWPNLKYIRTVTSGSFALSLPRLRWLAGPVPIHSGGYSSSEGVIGINLKTDGTANYVLACGTSFFEFIPLARVSENQPGTLDLDELEVDEVYEVVLTSCAGLYRYRLGDIVRITGHYGSAPTFEYLYRRGTVLNLVGEKSSELHTEQALATAVQHWLGSADVVKEYSVAGNIGNGSGRYTFYVELQDHVVVPIDGIQHADSLLDDALCKVNPYYLSNGREAERMRPAQLKLVTSGTFDALTTLQLKQAGSGNATQIKIPRVIISEEQLRLLEQRTVDSNRDIQPAHYVGLVKRKA